VGKPSALLFICGQDGRFNRGSMGVLKYLFRGAVGKELLDSEIVMDSDDESLEEIVFLIKYNSLAVFYRLNVINYRYS